MRSSFANMALDQAQEKKPRIEMNPADAAPRGIRAGDLVTVFNDRGSCQLLAVITDDTPPGVVISRKGRWPKLSPEGRAVNQLTSTRLSDMGGGATYHGTLVQVTSLQGSDTE